MYFLPGSFCDSKNLLDHIVKHRLGVFVHSGTVLNSPEVVDDRLLWGPLIKHLKEGRKLGGKEQVSDE